MRISAEEARAAHARANVGRALDELEGKWAPSHVWRMGSWALRRSFVTHPARWAVAAAVGALLLVGLVVWAAVSSDDDV